MNDRLLAIARDQSDSISDWDTDRAVGFLREIFQQRHPFDLTPPTEEIREAHALAQRELEKPSKSSTK